MSVATEIHRPPRGGRAATSHGEGLNQLIADAVAGDEHAWRVLVARYAALVNSVARQFRLRDADADDLTQVLWTKVFEHLRDLRVPDALPGWIASTARREAMRMTAATSRAHPVDPAVIATADDGSHSVEGLVLEADRRRAIRDGLAELQPQQRRLLLLLVAEPRLSYRQISQCLGIPIGSIGPTRSRCLRQLAETAPMRALLAT